MTDPTQTETPIPSNRPNVRLRDLAPVAAMLAGLVGLVAVAAPSL